MKHAHGHHHHGLCACCGSPLVLSERPSGVTYSCLVCRESKTIIDEGVIKKTTHHHPTAGGSVTRALYVIPTTGARYEGYFSDEQIVDEEKYHGILEARRRISRSACLN